MATVPVQQTPTEQIDTGGTPLFSATNIQPVQDTGVAQDIGRLSNAQKQFAKIAADLQDQTDDVKSNEAYRGYQEEADVKVNEYLETQRGDAIATVDYDQDTNKPITRYDKLVNDLEEISGKYLETLDNKSQKRIFNNKYSASKRISVNSASKHSLKQTRLKLDEESKSNIELSKNGAVNSFESFQDQNGDYAVNYYRGLLEIKRNAELNSRNTDINNGPLSAKYLEDVQKYNKEVMEGVVDKLVKLPGGHKLAEEYVLMHKPEEIKDVVTELEISIAKKHDDYNKEQCVNGVLTNNGNQNTGSFLDQTAKLMCLKSNHYVNDGNGASVHDGNHSNEINIAGQTQENNIDTLEKIKNESKFYKLDSNATLINEHQTTHLFAVQHLGVQKADSLYTKAKSLYPIDQRAYKENPKYAKAINKKIIENYNKLINEEANKKYKGDYVTAIANDLEIIEKGINYDGEFTSKVDFITGLRPLEVLKEEIKATITDPKQQKFALEDLEIKYNKIKNQRTQIYSEGLNAAKEIAFAEKGGWKNLEANGIKIENFSESDQALLKKGQPTESDKNVVIDLERNPIEVATNLDSYSHKLSQSDYLGLKQYAAELKGDSKVLAATVDSDMFDTSLIKFGYTDIVDKITDDKNAKDQYNFKFDYKQIKDAWKNRIDEVQTSTGKKLNRTEKQELLNEILADGVISKRTRKGIFGVADIVIPSVALEEDQFQDAFVLVGKDKVFVKRIPDEVRTYFIAGYEAAGIPYTEQMIANEYVLHGKSKSKKELLKFKEENNL
tara:strand:+ start:7590 stop:9938 length:2349 start_codon:yes stop_codon:yes gene_type:complete